MNPMKDRLLSMQNRGLMLVKNVKYVTIAFTFSSSPSPPLPLPLPLPPIVVVFVLFILLVSPLSISFF